VSTPRPPGPQAPSDDPTGGRGLTRLLMRLIPIALVVGLAIGVPLAWASGEWRVAVAVPLGLAALVGTIAAATEDGRVNRRVNAARRRGDDPGRSAGG
jgi:hypothetical protein